MMLTKIHFCVLLDILGHADFPYRHCCISLNSKNSITFAPISDIGICNSASFVFSVNLEMLGIHPRGMFQCFLTVSYDLSGNISTIRKCCCFLKNISITENQGS